MARLALFLFLFSVTGKATATGPLWLHHSATAVAVPGGSTNFFMDESGPPPLQPVVIETLTVANGATVPIPMFTSTPFAADTLLEPFVTAYVNLSADEAMDACVGFTLTVAHVDGAGVPTTLASRSYGFVTLPLSPDGGLTEFTGVGITAPLPPGTTVHTGEGLSLTGELTNNCGTDRTVWLSYDSQDAGARVGFATSEAVEFKCKTTTATLSAKFVPTKQKCLARCRAGVVKGSVLASECVPPFSGRTLDCVTKIETTTATKAAACLDCPECYSGGDCAADSTSRVGLLETIVDSFQPTIFCDDSGSGDGLTSDEFKCQLKIAGVTAKLQTDVMKCLLYCRKSEFKMAIPAGSCTPPVTDPKAAACLAKASLKAATSIDKACGLNPPECDTSTGAMWASTVIAIPQALDAITFCAD
jgi:hypothetical protein